MIKRFVCVLTLILTIEIKHFSLILYYCNINKNIPNARLFNQIYDERKTILSIVELVNIDD